MKLPKVNSVSWKNTNHYEIFADADPFWLRLPDLTDKDFNSETETGKRLGLVLDVFADYQRLQEENEKLKEVMNYIIKEKEKIDSLLKEEFEMAETLLLLEKRTILQNIAEIILIDKSKS